MMKKCLLSIFLAALLLVLLPGLALAQAYTFNIPQETVNVYWNNDGSASLDYVIVFNNDPNAHAIDYVDLGLPNPSFVDSSITADVNGARITDISRSGFQGTGPGVVAGVAIGLGSQTISPGSKGTVHAHIGTVQNMLQPDPQKGYASAVFSPAWFTTAHGETNLTVIFHFPKSVGQKDATYHESQPGWANQPIASTDDQGLVIFGWNNPNAAMNQKIDFGASFPGTVSLPPAATTSTSPDNSGIIFIALIVIVGLVIWLGSSYLKGEGKTAYEPPKISVEGYGIKRGLTAVEAAVLLKEPIDKILTMILFSVVKKGAAQVTNNDPLEIKVIDPLLNGLQPYETSFLLAFKRDSNALIREDLESAMGRLFREVDQSMKGFNRQQTIDYYRNLVRDAWAEVEAADTPEVTSQKFEKNMDWAMLDQEYAPRTQRLFENKPVILPVWWSHYNPSVHQPSAGSPLTPQVSAPASPGVGAPSGGNISLPVLPGADFAASIVRGTQNFSSKFTGDIATFTNNVTQKAAPPPPPPPPPPPARPAATSSSWGDLFGSSSGSGYHPHPTYHPHPSGGGGHHCACACAGGGR